jgi:hypothetical protein
MAYSAMRKRGSRVLNAKEKFTSVVMKMRMLRIRDPTLVNAIVGRRRKTKKDEGVGEEVILDVFVTIWCRPIRYCGFRYHDSIFLFA